MLERDRVAKEWHEMWSPTELLAARTQMLFPPESPEAQAVARAMESDPRWKREIEGARAKQAAFYDRQVELGLLPEAELARFYNRYLPRAYQVNLQTLFRAAKALRRGRWSVPNIRAAWEAMGQLKKRRDLPVETRILLGEILDPAYAHGKGIGDAATRLARIELMLEASDASPGSWVSIEELRENPTLGAFYRPIKGGVVARMRSAPARESKAFQTLIKRFEDRAYKFDFADAIESRARLEVRGQLEQQMGVWIDLWKSAKTKWNLPNFYINNIGGEALVLMPAAGIGPTSQPRAWWRGAQILWTRAKTDPLRAELELYPEWQELIQEKGRHYFAELSEAHARSMYPTLILGGGTPEAAHVQATMDVAGRATQGLTLKAVDRALTRVYRAQEALFLSSIYSHFREVRQMPPNEAFRESLRASGNFYGAPRWAQNLGPFFKATAMPFPAFYAAATSAIVRGVFFNTWPMFSVPLSLGIWNSAMRVALGMSKDDDERNRSLHNAASWSIFGFPFGPDLRVGKESFLRLTNMIPLGQAFDWALEPARLAPVRQGGPFPLFGVPLADAIQILWANQDPGTRRELAPEGSTLVERLIYKGEPMLWDVAPSPGFARRLDQLVLPEFGWLRELGRIGGAELAARRVDPFGERIPGPLERVAEFLTPVRFTRAGKFATPQSEAEALAEREATTISRPLVEREERLKGPAERRIREFATRKFREGGREEAREAVRRFMDEAPRSPGELTRLLRDLPLSMVEKTIRTLSQTHPDAAAETFLRIRELGRMNPEKERLYLRYLLRPAVQFKMSPDVKLRLREAIETGGPGR